MRSGLGSFTLTLAITMSLSVELALFAGAWSCWNMFRGLSRSFFVLVPVKGNLKVIECKDILDTRVLPTLWPGKTHI